MSKPNREVVEIEPEFLDRWIKIGEGLDQIQGFKFEKWGDRYVLLFMLDDGTETPIEWPEGTTTAMEAHAEAMAKNSA
jgi:hypothetical protein